MHLDDSESYAAPVGVLFSYYTDPMTLTTKFESFGDEGIRVTRSDNDKKGCQIQIDREVAVDPPRAIRKFFNTRVKVTQVEDWQVVEGKEARSRIVTKLKGIPASITTDLSIKEKDEGCLQSVHIEVECSTPILGPVIERFLLGDIRKNIDSEKRYLRKQIAKGG